MNWVRCLRYLFLRPYPTLYQALDQEKEQKDSYNLKQALKGYTRGDFQIGHTLKQNHPVWLDNLGHLSTVIGASGSGKSRLLTRMIMHQILKGKGISIIDQNIDLIQHCLMLLLQHSTASKLRSRLRYFHFSHPNWVLGLNPLHLHNPQEVFSTCDDLVEIFLRLFSGSFSHKQAETLRASLSILAVCRKTLLDLHPFLTDQYYREKLITQASKVDCDLSEPIRFLNYYHGLSASQQRPYYQTLLYKISTLLMVPELKASLCSPSHLDYPLLISQQAIAFFNVDSQIFKSYTPLLTSFLLIALKSAIRSQGKIPLQQRKEHYFVFDEFHTAMNLNEQDFVMFNDISRKYGLKSIFSFHYALQISKELLMSLLNSSQLLVCMRMRDRGSAEFMGKQLFTPPPKHIFNLSQGIFESPQALSQDLMSFPVRQGMIQQGNKSVLPFESMSVPDPPLKDFPHWEENEAQLLQEMGAYPRWKVMKQLKEYEASLSTPHSKHQHLEDHKPTIQLNHNQENNNDIKFWN